MHRFRQLAGLTWLALLLATGAVGCSTFNRDWRTAEPSAQPAQGIAGRWQGAWYSDANGHSGELRCLMTRVDEDTYRARFRARFWDILVCGYTVDLNVDQNAPDRWTFAGQANLGWWAGGDFRCEGTASANTFFATYDSTRDQGTFSLSRPRTTP